jgi:hypothetical protein
VNQLWNTFHVFFGEDDGSLITIDVRDLTADDVVRVYNHLRTGAEVYPPGVTVWSIESESDLPLEGLENPAAMVTAGKVQCFHHCLDGITIDGVSVPMLGVFVFPDWIELDYRPGPAWREREVMAFFTILRSINQIAPCAIIAPAHTHGELWTSRFREALDAPGS